MNKVIVPLRIFQMFKYNDFKQISGVGQKTALFLKDLSNNQSITSNIDIKLSIQDYNSKTSNKIRYNFISNNIVKMKNGSIYEFIYMN